MLHQDWSMFDVAMTHSGKEIWVLLLRILERPTEIEKATSWHRYPVAREPTEIDDSMSAAIEDLYIDRMYHYTSGSSKNVPEYLEYGFDGIRRESRNGRNS